MKIVSLIKSKNDLKKFDLINIKQLKDNVNYKKYENYEIGDQELYVYGILNKIDENKKYYILDSGTVLAYYKTNFFNISDSRKSKYWITKKYPKGYKYSTKKYTNQVLEENIEITGFSELVNNLDFFQ